MQPLHVWDHVHLKNNENVEELSGPRRKEVPINWAIWGCPRLEHQSALTWAPPSGCPKREPLKCLADGVNDLYQPIMEWGSPHCTTSACHLPWPSFHLTAVSVLFGQQEVPQQWVHAASYILRLLTCHRSANLSALSSSETLQLRNCTNSFICQGYSL